MSKEDDDNRKMDKILDERDDCDSSDSDYDIYEETSSEDDSAENGSDTEFVSVKDVSAIDNNDEDISHKLVDIEDDGVQLEIGRKRKYDSVNLTVVKRLLVIYSGDESESESESDVSYDGEILYP